MLSYKDKGFLEGEERPSDLVPRETIPNLRFRAALIEWAFRNKEAQKTLMAACARDLFFFTDTFVMVQDVKRHPDNPNRPFITWPFQREVMEDIDNSIGLKSVGVIKSRDLGGSTMPLLIFARRLLFFKGQTLMVMSRSEKWVDDPRNPDSLFWKLDYIMKWLPSWMTKSIERTSMSYVNKHLDSNIIGSSTTGDAGRGGRKQAILVDEYAAFDRKESFSVLASLQHNTRCRIYNSTPAGVGNGFHQVITDGAITVHRLHWSKHPVHGAGLYTSQNGKLEIIDKEYWEKTTCQQIVRGYPELEGRIMGNNSPAVLAKSFYKFNLDGKVRSPYYDYECLLCGIPKLIGQELDMDFIGSGSPFFDAEELREYTRLFGQRPLTSGELSYPPDYTDVNWAEGKDGRLQLWFRPDHTHKPLGARTYVIGCDISAGTGQSNSVVSVGDCMMRTKVASFVTPHMRAERFAEYVMAIGKWFGDAMIVFEGAGPGTDFGARLKELHYPNLYWMKKAGGKRAEKPGWFPNEDLKRNLLTEYGRALNMRELTNPDDVAVNECMMYEFTEGGKIAHVGSVSSADPSGAKKNHGDRVIADALMWMLMKRFAPAKSEEVIKENTLARLQKEREMHEHRSDGWSPAYRERAWCLSNA